MNRSLKNKTRVIPNRFLKIIILSLSGMIAFFALILPETFSQSSFLMEIGDVAP
ncbi:MAG: hypothetical protein XD73_1115, partial [Anaerolinea thermophila]